MTQQQQQQLLQQQQQQQLIQLLGQSPLLQQHQAGVCPTDGWCWLAGGWSLAGRQLRYVL
jgi:hypothetical protein